MEGAGHTGFAPWSTITPDRGPEPCQGGARATSERGTIGDHRPGSVDCGSPSETGSTASGGGGGGSSGATGGGGIWLAPVNAGGANAGTSDDDAGSGGSDGVGGATGGAVGAG